MVGNTAREAYIMRGTNSFELPNPLHKYASYNTIFTLSGITEEELQKGAYLTTTLHDVIARTGGIGPDGFRSAFRAGEIASAKGGPPGQSGGDKTVQKLRERNARYKESISVLERHHDVFIENVNILSTIGPNTDRSLANFTKMEFEIHEPYGITLIEKIRAATFNCGFLDYQDAPLLLTIEFKGFDENGKALRAGMSETRKIPILIARVDFDVNEGGAKYNIVAVPYGDIGFDDRFKVLRTRVDLTQGSWNLWKTTFEQALDDQMEQEKQEKVREFADKYRFEIDDKLLTKDLYEYAFTLDSIYADKTVDDLTQYILNESTPVAEQTQTADSGTTVVKALEDWLRNHPGFFDIAQDFWRAYLTMAGYKLPKNEQDRTVFINRLLTSKEKENELQALFLQYQYVPWFKIKTTVFTDTSRLDSVTKMHPKEIVYKAIPYKVHVLKLLSAGLSIGQVRWDKLVRKNYDYIYTGDNVDVQNLRINYKTAYYMRNVRGDDKTQNEAGLKKVVTQVSNLIFGQEDYPEPLLPLRSYPTNIKGRSTVENFKPGGNKAQEFFDYLTNPEADMLKIELDILGDPHYLCQDVLSCLKRLNNGKTEQIITIDSDFDENQFGSFNADQYMTLINLRYRLPADINDKEGTMFSGKVKYRDENLFFNGVYQVVKVDSKFDQGQFLQTLTCVRMNNQQGEGTAPNVITSSALKSKYIDKKKDADSVVADIKSKASNAKQLAKELGDPLK
tara:strand:- start:6200 stop:8404 length:2205 start_codon:yes stop_codon:yes gene_type:complete